MNPSEISRLTNEFGHSHVFTHYQPQDLREGDYYVAHMVLNRKFPSKVQNVGDGFNPSGREVDRAHRAMEHLEDVASGPVNAARGVRTHSQQQARYNKIFKHNRENALKVSEITRSSGHKDADGIGRFQMVGQISKEALVEESRRSGRSQSEIMGDVDTMDNLAKKTGWKVAE